jgi:hypothetical protein
MPHARSSGNTGNGDTGGVTLSSSDHRTRELGIVLHFANYGSSSTVVDFVVPGKYRRSEIR